MATVYRAYQPSMDRDVAVKVIHHRLAQEALQVERFQREARLIARLEHPHILPVYDFDGAHRPQYIVMRYLAGGTLKELLGARDLRSQPQQLVALLVQVASALDYAHRQGIVHRDLKPSNVMVDVEGNAFLTDFGIARLLADADEALGQEGAITGTPEYMAPEQASGDADQGPRVDLYALGVVVFELLTGRLPFAASSPLAMALCHLNDPPPRATDLDPRLPRALDAVLEKALAKEPAGRFASASELVQAVASALGVATPPAAPPLTPGLRPPAAAPARTGTGARRTLSDHNRLLTVLCVNAAEYVEMVDQSEGAEAARLAQSSLRERAAAVLAGFAGQVLAQESSGILAVWGAEATAEDDAERAVRGALALRDALGGAGAPGQEPLPLRMGIHTGLTLLTPLPAAPGAAAGLAASGATVSVAARLAERAAAAILIGHDTFRQVRGVFEVAPEEPIRIRGRGGARGSDLLPTYRVLAAKPRSFRARPRGIEGVETALVGRTSELAVLQSALAAAIEARQTRVVVLVAGAGLGKSRLRDELETWADLRPERIYLFRGRATPAARLSPFALLRDMLSFRFEILENDTPAVVRDKLESGVARLLRQERPDQEMAHLIGHLAGFDLGDSPHVRGLLGDPGQLAARARRLLSRLVEQAAAIQPLLVTLEDVHNADDASLDLLAELLEAHPDLPLAALLTTRPGLFERRPGWGSGLPHQQRVVLEPLDRADSCQLVEEILQKAGEVPAALRDHLVERAEGNPLFMEELVKMLIEDRAIVKESEHSWRVEATRLDHLPVPPTLAGLLQARLDTLLYPERLTLERAAVVGRVFADAAVAALDAADDPALHVEDLATVLARLVERGFLYRPVVAPRAGSVDHVFAQSMLRDLIYQSLLRSQRSAYHAALAEWLAQSPRADEYQAQIAEHFERAGQGRAAASSLLKAGDRARGVCAFADARAMYLRALELVAAPAGTPAGGEQTAALECRLRLQHGEVCRLLGSYAEAKAQLQLALGLARAAGDPRSAAAALYQLSQVASVQGDYDDAQRCLDESLPLARAAGDPGILAQVLFGLGDLEWRHGRYAAAIPTLEASLAEARRGDDPSAVLLVLNRLGSVRMFQKRTAEARRLLEEGRELATSTGNRERLVAFLNNLGEIERLQGEAEKARDLYRETLLINREVGRRDVESVVLSNLGAVSLQLGDLAAAERYAREGLRLAHAIGLTRMVAGSLILFAQLAVRAGDAERGLELLGLVAAHPAADADLKEYAAPTLEELGQMLPAAAIEAGLARGRALPFDATVEGLLQRHLTPSSR